MEKTKGDIAEQAAEGGKARAKSLLPVERQELARRAANARWAAVRGKKAGRVEEAQSKMPTAKYKGFLNLVGTELPCYVLDDGRRVIGRTNATELLTQIKGGGSLEKYLGVQSLKPFLDLDLLLERMVSFRLPEVEGLAKDVKGLPADLFIEICKGLVAALHASEQPQAVAKLTERQVQIALRASMFLGACAKTGLDALIDEATGAQYDRAEDALRVKLRAYLEEEMRPWEKTFPDELWKEFGRLTAWKGTVSHRPKYWGKLVMDLIYDYLDADVARWLKENAPTPQRGQNYHQWLTSQYGLRKLLEHIWVVVGIAKTCRDLPELKLKMGQLYGREPVQYTLYLPPPSLS